MRLPDRGLTPDAVTRLVHDAGAGDADWRTPRTWSLVYRAPLQVRELIASAAAHYANENALSHHAFPSAAYFESNVIAMVAPLVGGSDRTPGLFTSGGTESILLALKAYRDHATGSRSTVIVPRTAHPAFAKAAQLLGLPIRLVDDPRDIAGLIDDRTLAVGLSAPNFPYGELDPIGEVAGAAAQHGVGVHVDAALGGMFLPFLDSPPRFGLDVSGVTSLSLDLHKYGYAPKGAAVLLFAEESLRRAAYFVTTHWPGGAFAAAGMLGTRPVGTAAGAFAALTGLGRDGYRSTVADVMRTAQDLRDGLTARGWKVVGEPAMAVFAAAPPDPANLGGVIGAMSGRGWRLDALTDPPALHFVVMPSHADVLAEFLSDLDLATNRAGAGGDDAVSSYGVMVRGGNPTEDSLLAYLDNRFDPARQDRHDG